MRRKYVVCFLLLPSVASSARWERETQIGLSVGIAFHKVKDFEDKTGRIEETVEEVSENREREEKARAVLGELYDLGRDFLFAEQFIEGRAQINFTPQELIDAQAGIRKLSKKIRKDLVEFALKGHPDRGNAYPGFELDIEEFKYRRDKMCEIQTLVDDAVRDGTGIDLRFDFVNRIRIGGLEVDRRLETNDQIVTDLLEILPGIRKGSRATVISKKDEILREAGFSAEFNEYATHNVFYAAKNGWIFGKEGPVDSVIERFHDYLTDIERSTTTSASEKTNRVNVSKRYAKTVIDAECAREYRKGKFVIGGRLILGTMLGKVKRCNSVYVAAMPKIGFKIRERFELFATVGLMGQRRLSPLIGGGLKFDMSDKTYAKLEYDRWKNSKVRANVLKIGFGWRIGAGK